ncbi:acyl-CoA dehydratase activase [Hydrogenophaga sp.]|uniref:acyl-CoA dehydratase activase n=1 Tax=Hydrogenophaga sp. TaxID=1904254 RepID=UPI00271DC8EA|nr:acyl-CoA dehydratase activase [Hydrogenophaga sp.]MDO9439081.1 acyl-CoA dehydratase activase [Hydrogenophaga sp.]
MSRYVMGIDFGSTTAKTVILDDTGRVLASCVGSMGAVSDEGVRVSTAGALQQAGLTQAEITRTVSTGYGRRMLEIADKSYTEITCHARGAVAMMPQARLVIDIGGQDSKVIAVDERGLLSQFAMNDRCAAGTGKFLEVLARAMAIELEAMGPLALTSTKALQISSMCATFAETEVISLLAEGNHKADVLAAVHAAIASRTVGLVSRVGKRGPVVMTGGVAKNVAAVQSIEQALGMKVHLPPDPQIAGALGAALLALDEMRALDNVPTPAQDMEMDAAMNTARACVTGCKGQPAQEQAVPIWTPKTTTSRAAPAHAAGGD